MITLTLEQLDAFQEMVNIGIGQAAGVLNAMLNAHVVLHAPVVKIVSQADLEEKKLTLKKEMLSAVRIGFKGPFAGNASLMFPTKSAVKLVILLTEDITDPQELDSIMVGTLTEVGNIVLNGIMGAIGTELKERIFYSVPNYVDNPLDVMPRLDPLIPENMVVWVETRFEVEEHNIDGYIVMIFESESLGLLVEAIDRVMRT
jgi:chemotaxis protein CheC